MSQTVADPFDPAAVPEPDSRKAPEPEPEQTTKDEGSNYVVLRAYSPEKDGFIPSADFLEGETWQNLGVYNAGNGSIAIRKAIAAQFSDENGHPKPEADGWYATVPQRSWSPALVAVKQPPTTVSIG